jgi:hypothetical protein
VNDDEAEEVTESESADEEDELEGNTEFSGAALLEAAADASPMAPVAIKAQPAKFHPERITAQVNRLSAGVVGSALSSRPSLCCGVVCADH